MAILIIGGALIGVLLGRYLKVLVLIPVCSVLVALLLSRPVPATSSLAYQILEIVTLLVFLQFGYAAGLLSRNIRFFFQRSRNVLVSNLPNTWRSLHSR